MRWTGNWQPGVLRDALGIGYISVILRVADENEPVAHVIRVGWHWSYYKAECAAHNRIDMIKRKLEEYYNYVLTNGQESVKV